MRAPTTSWWWNITVPVGPNDRVFGLPTSWNKAANRSRRSGEVFSTTAMVWARTSLWRWMGSCSSAYETWKQLEDYCELSANPVGELVLRVFGLATPARIALSDRVCTALQLVEHLQDVAEDVARGRLYLPAEDLARFGCSHEQLSRLIEHSSEEGDGSRIRSGAATGSDDLRLCREQLCETVTFEVVRARELLGAGIPLISGISGRPKLAVGAFLAGGCAALEAIEQAHCDVFGGVRRASRPRRAWALVRLLAESR